MRQTIEPGAPVRASDGDVGEVERVISDPATGEPTAVVVRTGAGERVEVPVALIDPAATGPEVRLTAARASLTGGITQTGVLDAVGDQVVVPVREEVLVPTTRPIESGTVRVHKRVETVPAETAVELRRDDVTIERVAVDRPIDAVPAPRHEGDTLVIPVVEEVLVTEKRLVLREEIRVTRRPVAETMPVRGTVRREVIEIEEIEETVGAPRSDEPARGRSAPDQPPVEILAADQPLT